MKTAEIRLNAAFAQEQRGLLFDGFHIRHQRPAADRVGGCATRLRPAVNAFATTDNVRSAYARTAAVPRPGR
jgi:hypothetical protein